MSKDIVLVFLVLCINVVLIGMDIAVDLNNGNTFAHVSTETIAFFFSMAGLTALTYRFWIVSSKCADLRRNATKTNEEKELWKEMTQKFVSGFGDAIDKQMALWDFTTAEKEIALMLLKGCSFKEIAAMRNTGERTVRQQALDIYRKAGLAGRAELSAFFLEDILAPQKQERKRQNKE